MKNIMNGTAWSVEDERNGYMDDLFIGETYEECLNYMRANKEDWMTTEYDFQIAQIQIDDGLSTYCYELIKKDEIKENL